MVQRGLETKQKMVAQRNQNSGIFIALTSSNWLTLKIYGAGSNKPNKKCLPSNKKAKQNLRQNENSNLIKEKELQETHWNQLIP